MNTPAHAKHGTELIHLDPTTLHLGLNVRPGSIDADLVDSVRAHGVLQAINVYSNDSGDWTVEDGQSRTLAAVEAQCETVPCRIIDAPEDNDSGRAGLLLRQFDQNQRRRGLTAAEQAHTVDQLAAFGISAAQIAKRTKIRRATVEATVGMRESTRDKLAGGTLTLDQAAAIDEFDDETASDLANQAQYGGFDHALARARQDKLLDAAIAEATEQAHAKGWSVASDEHAGAVHPFNLKDSEGNLVQIDEDDPGEHVVVSLYARMGSIDTRTGEEVREWNIWRNDGPAPEGKVPAEYAERGPIVTRGWKCTDPAARGWTRLDNAGSGRTQDLSDDEREQAKAERKRTIAGNKAWDAAQTVRRDFLAGLTTRKSAPNGGQTFITATMLNHAGHLAHFKAQHLMRDLGVQEISEQAAKATATAFLIACAAHEAALDRYSWRKPMPGVADYLHALVACGYTLAAVERAACGEEVATDEL